MVRRPYIEPVECIDYGACVPVCPVSTIFVVDDLTQKWRRTQKLTPLTYRAASSHWISTPSTAEVGEAAFLGSRWSGEARREC